MEVAAALAVFIGSHSLVAARLKPVLTARLGHGAYAVLYSALSIVLLAWVVLALGRAERVLLWSTPHGAHSLALVATALGFALMGVGALTPNPFSVSLRQTGFNPGRPGVLGWTRHPLLWGLGLWAAAHLPANGTWPDVLVFGAFALFALLGAPLLERRSQRRLGLEAWTRLSGGRGALDANAALGGVIGLALWALLLWAHPFLFGVDPWAIALSSLAGGR